MGIRYTNFIRGLSTNWISLTGTAITTSTFIVFIIIETLRLIGVIKNAYVGLITYLVFPTLFVVGLLLIPVGWWIYAHRKSLGFKELLGRRFKEEETKGKLTGSRLFRSVVIFSVINILFLSVVSFRALHFMDEPSFCGTACHKVMNPEWTTYQRSPHARVKCVECHVGAGLEAMIDAKINGAHQIISLIFNLYEKPIPTPIKNLRPARETCEKCHWPEKFSGDRLKTIIHYQFDQNNNPVYTTLKLKIGTGAAGLDRGSHWHIAEKNQVRYQAVDSKRKIMKWVEVRESEGNFRRYTNRSLTSSQTDKEQEIRILDCVDCHNRATHIYERAENALDERISMDLINRNLPYLKREGLDAISNYYADKIQSDSIIGGHLKDFYAVNFPETTEIQGAEIGQALTVLKEIYARNIHPEMNIYWGSYPDHLGHRNGTGCTRCHNPNLVDEKGEAIPDQCTLCHSVLSCEEDQPFKYLFPLDEGNPEYLLKKYFQDEFFENRDPKSAR